MQTLVHMQCINIGRINMQYLTRTPTPYFNEGIYSALLLLQLILQIHPTPYSLFLGAGRWKSYIFPPPSPPSSPSLFPFRVPTSYRKDSKVYFPL